MKRSHRRIENDADRKVAFYSRIRPRSLAPEQEQIVVDEYICGEMPARDVASLLGPEWGQSDVYSLSKKLQQRRGLSAPNRHRDQLVIDWDLVHALRLEGTAWNDIAEYIGNTDVGLRQLYHHHRHRGRFNDA